MTTAEREFDPCKASDVVAGFLRFVHQQEAEDMRAAWALLGDEARQHFVAGFIEQSREAVMAAMSGDVDANEAWAVFADWLRPRLRAALPLPRFAPEPYTALSGWEAGMALVQIAEPANEPFFAFRVERVEPSSEADRLSWPWRVHSFSPLLQTAAA